MLKVVVDTNVLISSLISPEGTCAKIISLWTGGHFVLCLSEAVINEIERVLRYPKIAKLHKFTKEEIDVYVGFIRDYSLMTSGLTQVDVLGADPQDNMFLSCAAEAEADYIVSGDSHLLDLGSYEGIGIVTPSQFRQSIDF